DAVVGAEVERAIDIDQVAGSRTIGAGVDVLDHRGTGCRAIALPKLVSVRAVVRTEVERAADAGQADAPATGMRAGGSGVEVLHQRGVVAAPIRGPKLPAME